ncbi:hypothetical protein QU668_07575 [Schaalia sp. HMT-877]|nr:hypothetical protein QU668_07575 [Schaalia sp. HMT-877]
MRPHIGPSLPTGLGAPRGLGLRDRLDLCTGLAPLTLDRLNLPTRLAPLTLDRLNLPTRLAPLTLDRLNLPTRLAPLTLDRLNLPTRLAPLTLDRLNLPTRLAPLTLNGLNLPTRLAPLTLDRLNLPTGVLCLDPRDQSGVDGGVPHDERVQVRTGLGDDRQVIGRQARVRHIAGLQPRRIDHDRVTPFAPRRCCAVCLRRRHRCHPHPSLTAAAGERAPLLRSTRTTAQHPYGPPGSARLVR